MQNKYLSRKFLLAVVGGLVVIANAALEANGLKALDPQTVLAFASIVVGYIAAEAHVDGKAALLPAATGSAPGAPPPEASAAVAKQNLPV